MTCKWLYVIRGSGLMIFFKQIMLFINNYRRELQRKWKTLPLLLLYPVIFLALISVIIITIFTPPKDEPLTIGLIDLDQSEETQLVADLLEQSSQIGTYIELHQMTEQEAIKKIELNEISSYVTFPENFTNNLYEGKTVNLDIVGNPQKQMDSLLINEFIESITRHIRSSQANILTINDYAIQLGLDPETRSNLLYEQFTNFFLYTLDKDRSLQEDKITNYATTTPIYYFALGSWFIVTTIWLMNFYTLLYQEEESNMSQRLSLYGVLQIQRVTARIIVTIIASAVFSVLLFYCLQLFLPFKLFMEDYLRAFWIMILYSLFYLISLALIEIVFDSHRIRLFSQLIYTLLAITLSGAIIPSMYFPLSIQPSIPYIFSNEAFYWLQEILLKDRLFADYIPLILMNSIALFILISFSLWKERSSI